ncbi:MAG: DNA-3-methyladenine glycosylase family protein [Actinomycetota bacterium]
MNERTILAPGIDLRLTLSALRHGPRDPTFRVEGAAVWRAVRTPGGPGTVRYERAGDDVKVAAWGPGADWLLDAAPDAIGLNDNPDDFRPPDTLMRTFHRSRAGLRMCRSNRIVQTLVPTILEQRVTTVESHSAYRYLVHVLGEPAPGPTRMKLPPDPKVLAALPYHAFHRFGIERGRATTIRAVCSYAKRLEETVTMSREIARKRLRALPGVGAWTIAEIERVVFGDPDAVRPNDYHLPHVVSWVLAGERRADDERMMELLEPYRGHRARAALLMELCADHAPRRAPRARLRNIERH